MKLLNRYVWVLAVSGAVMGILWFYSMVEAAVEFYSDWNDVTCLTMDDDSIWAGTKGGLLKWNARTGKYTKFTFLDGLPGNNVRAIATGSDGRKYISTQEGGVCSFDGRVFEPLQSTTLNTGIITCMRANGRGEIYAANNRAELFRVEKNILLPVPFIDKPDLKAVNGIGFDGDDRLWVGTNLGPMMYIGEYWAAFSRGLNEADNEVYALDFIPGDAMYFATNAGVWLYQDDVWQVFTSSEGLPGNIVRMIKHDRGKSFWIVVGNDTVYFDGEKFSVLTPDHKFQGGEIRDILVDAAGVLWCATGKGLYTYDGHKWSGILISEVIPRVPVRKMITDRLGGILAGSAAGVYRFTGKGWDEVNPGGYKLKTEILCMFRFSGEEVWLGTRSDGIYIIMQDGMVHLTESDGLPTNEILAIYPLSRDHYWIGTRSGAYLCKDGVWRGYTTADGLPGNVINDIDCSRDTVWLAGDGGVTIIQDDHITVYDTDDGARGSSCIDMARDSSDNLWFAWDRGISVLREGMMRFYALPENVSDDISVMFPGSGTRLHIGLRGGGLYTYQNGEYSVTDTGVDLKYCSITAGLLDTQGNLWLGTTSGTLCCRFEEQGEREISGNTGDRVRQLPQDLITWYTITNGNDVHSLALQDNILWAGTTGGLVRWDLDAGTFEKYLAGKQLSGNRIWKIYLDNEGILWAGTERNGLTLHQNDQWRTITSLDGLPNPNIHDIVDDGSGGKWLATWGAGVLGYSGRGWEIHGTRQGLTGEEVSCLLVDSEKRLWVGTEHGLSSYLNGKWYSYTEENGLINNHVRTLCQAPDGAVWIGTWNGISRFDGVIWKSFAESENLPDNYIQCLHVDRFGRIWAGTAKGGIAWCEDGEWIPVSYPGVEEGYGIRDIDEDADGRLYFATGKGIRVFHMGIWTQLVTTDTLISNQVQALAQDRNGDVLIGTTEGIMNWDGYTFETLSSEIQEEGNQTVHYDTRALLVDSLNNLWTGTSGYGVHILSGKRWHHYLAGAELLHNQITCFYEDRSGSIWIGTFRGLNRYRQDKWTRYTTREGLPDSYIWSVYEDKYGQMWTGTMKGVSRYDDDTWVTYTSAEGLPSDGVYSICEDIQGRIWVATFEGACMFDGTAWRTYSMDDGLPDNRIRKIVRDPAGNLWFATEGGGISRYDGSRFSNFSTRDGVADDDVRDILITSSGELVLATGAGISHAKVFDISLSGGFEPHSEPVRADDQGTDASGPIFMKPAGNVEVFPKHPKLGNKMIVTYKPDPQNIPMVNAVSVDLVLEDHLYKYTMQQQNNLWTVTLVPPADRPLLGFYFINENGYTDDNRGNFWVTALFNADGRPVKDAYFIIAKKIFLGTAPDRELGYSYLQKELSHYPLNWKARLFRWAVGQKYGDFSVEDLKRERDELNARYPNSCEIDYLSAKISGIIGDRDKQLAMLNQVIQNHPNCSLADEALYELAEIFPDQAVEYLDRLVRAYPSGNMAVEAYRRLAYIYEYLDPDPEKYVENSLAWITVQPADPKPYFNLARYLLEHQPDNPDLLEYARKGADRIFPDPLPQEYLTILGKAYLRSGYYSEAELYLMEAFKKQKTRALLNELMKTNAATGNVDQLLPLVFEFHMHDIRDQEVLENLKTIFAKTHPREAGFEAFYTTRFSRFGYPVPDASFSTMDNGSVKFPEIAGGISVVYIWAPWNSRARQGLKELNLLCERSPGIKTYCLALDVGREIMLTSKHYVPDSAVLLYTDQSSLGEWIVSDLPVIGVTDGKGKLKFVHQHIDTNIVDLVIFEVQKLLDQSGN